METPEDELLDSARQGDSLALEQLFARCRDRLRRSIKVRMDRRLQARIDASDVVQEALAEATRRFPSYAEEQPVAFFPWLREIAWNRLIDLHRRHMIAAKRSLLREEAAPPVLPDESILELAGRLIASGTSPSVQAVRQEMLERVQTALKELPKNDREVLILRHLERMSNAEIADTLKISEGSVKVRHFRALQRIRALLDEE